MAGWFLVVVVCVLLGLGGYFFVGGVVRGVDWMGKCLGGGPGHLSRRWHLALFSCMQSSASVTFCWTNGVP